MRHDEQVRLIKQMCAHLDAGTNVDAGGLRRLSTTAYTDPAIAEREWNEWFVGMPQYLGLSGDLPEPGSFITNDDLGIPILATRDDEGEFRAFVNSCRHRGVIVEEEERGTKRRFTCPFHAWTYDPNGALVGLPKDEHFGEMDRACMGLRELPSEERHGMLFVHPDPNGEIDLDWLLGEWFNEEFASWNLDTLRPHMRDTYEVDCNWKLAMDTFGETYHFPALHSDTINLGFHGNVQCYDEDGHLHRMILCKRAIDVMRTMPEEQWDIAVAGLPVYWIWPNVVFMPSDMATFVVRTYPDRSDPGKHTSQIDIYLWPHALTADGEVPEEASMALTIAEAFARIIRDEDYVMSASQQAAANSGSLEHIVFGRNEPALHHYHNTYRRMLGHEPLPLHASIDA